MKPNGKLTNKQSRHAFKDAWTVICHFQCMLNTGTELLIREGRPVNNRSVQAGRRGDVEEECKRGVKDDGC